jgi:pimeloyl-ACP methyl ester carboxylesterase
MSSGAPATPKEAAARSCLTTLIERFDPRCFDAPGGRARLRLEVRDHDSWDAVVEGDRIALEEPQGGRPDAALSADLSTWRGIERDIAGGMDAYRAGRLDIRRNLHLGVGLIAATSGNREPGRLRFRRVRTHLGNISVVEAGVGEPVVMLHGLGGTKVSFLPTIAALAPSYRTIALDLPGFGDSVKPVGARYDAPYFARSVLALLDAMDIERCHVVGHSMGGRVALEIGFTRPYRVGGMVLMTSALAWRRGREWASYLRFIRPELGFLQIAPRRAVEAFVHRIVPGGDTGWAAAGVEEFLRAYHTPRGRVAFYAAARSIYLDEPDDFWERLAALAPDCLFIWGRRDRVVPIGFARHVRSALPSARHAEIDCGHIPQFERPAETHMAMKRFLRSCGALRAAA